MKKKNIVVLSLYIGCLLFLAGCSSSSPEVSAYTVWASWTSSSEDAVLQSVGSSILTRGGIVDESFQNLSTDADFTDDVPKNYIVGYRTASSTSEKSLSLYSESSIAERALRDNVLQKLSITRVGDIVTADSAKSVSLHNKQEVPFDVVDIPPATLSAYDNDCKGIAQALNEQFLAYGGAGDEVAYVEPDYRVHMTSSPNDVLYTMFQWNMQQKYMNIPVLHDITRGNPDIIVAVIDTGVYQNSPDFLASTFIKGYDYVNNDTDPTDDNRHGTHVTGTIAGATNNSIGVASVAPGVSIMPLKVLDSTGSGSSSDVSQAIYYAVNNGARVINMSLGASGTSKAETDACHYAYDHGVVVVASAGNNKVDEQYSPGGIDTVIGVGAVGRDINKKASYSNYGSWVDVAAFGGSSDYFLGSVYQWTIREKKDGPIKKGYYGLNGTSMASPHVAGLAALLLSKNPSLTPAEVTSIICETALQNTDSRYSLGKYGVIDAVAALRSLDDDIWAPNDDSVVTGSSSGYGVGDAVQLSVVDGTSSEIAFFATEGTISLAITSDAKNPKDLSLVLSNARGTVVAQAQGSVSESPSLFLSYEVEKQEEGFYTLILTSSL